MVLIHLFIGLTRLSYYGRWRFIMAILKIEACVSCGTPASSTVISAAYVAQIQRKGGYHECTSSAGEVEGGGPCCQFLAHSIEEGCIYCGSNECVAFTYGESVCG